MNEATLLSVKASFLEIQVQNMLYKTKTARIIMRKFYTSGQKRKNSFFMKISGIAGIFLLMSLTVSAQQVNPASAPDKVVKQMEQKDASVDVKANTQRSETVANQELPADFPRFVNTGNPEFDNAKYQNEKAKWINDNPERYKALTSEQSIEEKERKKAIRESK